MDTSKTVGATPHHDVVHGAEKAISAAFGVTFTVAWVACLCPEIDVGRREIFVGKENLPCQSAFCSRSLTHEVLWVRGGGEHHVRVKRPPWRILNRFDTDVISHLKSPWCPDSSCRKMRTQTPVDVPHERLHQLQAPPARAPASRLGCVRAYCGASNMALATILRQMAIGFSADCSLLPDVRPRGN